MKKFFVILALSMPLSCAFAQQPQFVPYTVTQEDHTKLLNYLGDQPAKIAIPLIQALNLLEQKAIEDSKKKIEENKK